MTNREKNAIIGLLSVAKKLLESKAATNTSLNTVGIGPMFDDIIISDKLKDLPFPKEEIIKALDKADAAIKFDSGMAGIVDRATEVLAILRGLLPVLLSL